MKAMPPSYCLWCEEKLASVEWWPYCTSHCKMHAKMKKR